MHILHVDLGRQMRGGQHQVLLLLRTLQAAGHSSLLLAPPGSPLFQAAQAAHLPVQTASLLRLHQLAPQFDIVHVHDARAHTAAALVCRTPFVVARRVAFLPKNSPWSRWKYRRPARFFAVSRFVAGQLQAARVPASKIDVIYDAVELTPLPVSRNPSGPVLALASADPLKGRDLIRQASSLAGIPVVFTANLAQDLPSASAFVYISRSEGLGSAALLAMSQGVPVIASRIDGMRELFEDGISGLLVDNDPSAIARCLQRLQSGPELADRLIANARRRVEQMFSPSCLLLHTLAAYRRALAL